MSYDPHAVHDPSAVCYHRRKDWQRNAKGDVIHPSSVPPAPEFKPRRAPTQAARLGGYIDTPKDALEILSRMAGGTTFKVPGQGGSGRHVGQDDLPHALGFVKDPLQQRLALALACQTLGEWPAIVQLAYAPLLSQLAGRVDSRDLVKGTKRHRIRLVLRDVMLDLTHGEPRCWREAAKAARMRRSHYHDLYNDIRKFVQTEAQCGAHIAVKALFAG